jgi:hypothetical protein
MDNPVDGTDGKLGRGFMSADKLEEVDIGNDDKPRPTFINANLESDFREELIKLLKEYKDFFAWDYSEMTGLDHSIVEHRLPIKLGFRPYKQPPRKIYKDEVLADVKKEVERLLDANFIQPCRYAEWISNIVPVYKKNGKMRVFIEQCLWIPELRIFCGFCAKGHPFSRIRLKQSSRMRLRKNKARSCKHGGIITIQSWKLKILYFIAEDQTSLVQTNRKACLVQTGDE